jgi:predicted DNA-binding transcriptional regulator AlpA
MATIAGTHGRFLTVEETAGLLRVSRTAAYRLLHSRELPVTILLEI